jgi:N-acetylglucosaminyldiphosphoundecaprenol N-acetyl-beta-D-mannosaminyltransferase
MASKHSIDPDFSNSPSFYKGSGKRIKFLGIPMDSISMEETVNAADEAMANHVRLQHVCINVAKLVNAQHDPNLLRDVMESDIINIDGMGVVWGARLLGQAIPCRVSGIDLMERLLTLCAERGYRVYILGARQEVLDCALASICKRHPELQIAGSRNGYFSRDEELGVVQEIRTSRADCLFVALGSPMKERFTREYRDCLGVSFLMGVGGSVDVIAGVTRRAPRWMRNSGLEWLYRLGQEPRRLWRRYLVTNAKYALLLLVALIGAQSNRTARRLGSML